MAQAVPRYCADCGAPLAERLIDAEYRRRLICTGCGAIAYRNPQVLVTTIVAKGGQVLLCRRAQAPAIGRWALPGGFMECGETLEDAAARETLEETGIRIAPSDLRLHAVSTLPEISEVYVGFRAELQDEQQAAASSECQEVGFFSEDQMPWSELAYPDIAAYLRRYFQEYRDQAYSIHFSKLDNASVVGLSYRISSVEEVRRLKSGH